VQDSDCTHKQEKDAPSHHNAFTVQLQARMPLDTLTMLASLVLVKKKELALHVVNERTIAW